MTEFDTEKGTIITIHGTPIEIPPGVDHARISIGAVSELLIPVDGTDCLVTILNRSRFLNPERTIQFSPIGGGVAFNSLREKKAFLQSLGLPTDINEGIDMRSPHIPIHTIPHVVKELLGRTEDFLVSLHDEFYSELGDEMAEMLEQDEFPAHIRTYYGLGASIEQDPIRTKIYPLQVSGRTGEPSIRAIKLYRAYAFAGLEEYIRSTGTVLEETYQNIESPLLLIPTHMIPSLIEMEHGLGRGSESFTTMPEKMFLGKYPVYFPSLISLYDHVSPAQGSAK